jgi:carbonic anhydrase
MTDLTTLLDRNRVFAEDFGSGELAIRPRLSTFILTCLDARVDPAHVFKLELGDAIVMRNGGGWITPAVLRDLAILGALNATLPGGTFEAPQLVVIHHTDCGMGRLANPSMQDQLAQRLGVTVEDVGGWAITDPAASVAVAIERLRNTPGTPDQLVVSGLVYDTAAGTMTEVAAPAPLRQPQ